MECFRYLSKVIQLESREPKLQLRLLSSEPVLFFSLEYSIAILFFL